MRRNLHKSNSRKRDISADPIYKKQNYNKPKNQKSITPFTWNKRCKYANRIYKQKDNKLIINEYLKFGY